MTIEQEYWFNIFQLNKYLWTLHSIEISMSELETALSQLEANKGPGEDDISPRLVKLCSDEL
jgi:hypothetical protein